MGRNDVKEAVLPNDRTAVMNSRPGKLKTEGRISMPRPGSFEIYSNPDFISIKQDLFQIQVSKSLK